MSMTDPIADMLTRIRNAAAVGKPTVKMPSSRTKVAIAKVLQDEGYIGGSRVTENGAKDELEIELKYYEGRPVIARLQRISRSGLRQYRGKDALPKVLNGLGIAIIDRKSEEHTSELQSLMRISYAVFCLKKKKL